MLFAVGGSSLASSGPTYGPISSGRESATLGNPADARVNRAPNGPGAAHPLDGVYHAFALRRRVWCGERAMRMER